MKEIEPQQAELPLASVNIRPSRRHRNLMNLKAKGDGILRGGVKSAARPNKKQPRPENYIDVWSKPASMRPDFTRNVPASASDFEALEAAKRKRHDRAVIRARNEVKTWGNYGFWKDQPEWVKNKIREGMEAQKQLGA